MTFFSCRQQEGGHIPRLGGSTDLMVCQHSAMLMLLNVDPHIGQESYGVRAVVNVVEAMVLGGG